MGAVARWRVQEQELRPDHHQPCRTERLCEVRRPELLLAVRQPGRAGADREGRLDARTGRAHQGAAGPAAGRKSVVEGTGGSGSVAMGGRRYNKKKKTKKANVR